MPLLPFDDRLMQIFWDSDIFSYNGGQLFRSFLSPAAFLAAVSFAFPSSSMRSRRRLTDDFSSSPHTDFPAPAISDTVGKPTTGKRDTLPDTDTYAADTCAANAVAAAARHNHAPQTRNIGHKNRF
jgi:hypothetical protein